MKFCANCGAKLAQPNPKHCPECGKTVRPDAEGGQAQPAGVHGAVKALLAFAAVVLVLAVVFAAGIYASAPWTRANEAGNQYYGYLTMFKNDLADLQSLNGVYGGAAVDDYNVGEKAAIATAYASTAKQALVSWGYFESFMTQNDAPLRLWNIDGTATRAQIETGKATVLGTAAAMASDLEGYAGSNASRTNSTANAVGLLNGVLER